MVGPVKPCTDRHDDFSEAPLFFVLSKTLGVALLPINLLAELGILSVVLMATRFAALGRRLAVITLVVLGLAIATGIDKRLEAAIVDLSPEWLTTLTTRF